MSLLLDALNKADQERKRSGENPNISSNHDNAHSYAPNKNFSAVMLLLAAIVLIILLAAVYWLGKQNQQLPAEKTATTQSITTTPQKPLAAARVSGISNSEPTNPPAAKNIPEANDEENIASLYQQQATDTSPVPGTATTHVDNKPQSIPENHSATPAITAQAPTASPVSLSQFANLPDIQDLPANVLSKIPSLKYSEHNYNGNGGSVVINGTVKHVNDQLIEGLVIDKILEDGIILHFENYSFKMRAMNTWVNM